VRDDFRLCDLPGAPEPVATASSCTSGELSQSALSVHPEKECTTFSWISGHTGQLKTQRNHVVTTRHVSGRRAIYGLRAFADERWPGRQFRDDTDQVAIGTAGTLAKTEDATKALTAINTAIIGAKAGFDKDILFERTISVLITQMRAERAKQKEIILRRLPSDYGDWPIGLAMSDLLSYENAGSLSTALSSVAENAAADRQVSEERAVQALVTVNYDGSAAATAIQDYIDLDVVVANQNARLQNIRDAMTAAGIPQSVRVTDFVYGPDPRKQDVLVRLMAKEAANPAALGKLAAGLPSN
jgi:hypothetical protein